MKILIVGASGTIGSAIVSELKARHEIITAGLHHGDIKVDISKIEAIEDMYQAVGKIDALVAVTGKVTFLSFTEMTSHDYYLGLNHKLMGQVNLVLIGQNYINPQGSYTLTSGILNRDPIRTGSSAAMVNGALEGFVKSVAIELPNDTRINLVSPTIITESLHKYGKHFYGFASIPASRAALAYSKSVEGAQTGQVYYIY
jgi:NAD(P)-dependent dehydrogenase (short-subunit alcohol dehydrogenase family)